MGNKTRFRLAYKICIRITDNLTKKTHDYVDDMLYWAYQNAELFYSNTNLAESHYCLFEIIFCFEDLNDAILFKLTFNQKI